MKRTASMLLISSILLLPAFPSGMYVSHQGGISGAMEAVVPLCLDLQSLENEYVNIGFSDERVSEAYFESLVKTKDSVGITLSEDLGMAYNEEDVFAYWQIKHGGRLHIRIYSESPYSRDGSGDALHFHIVDADSGDVLFSGFEDSASGYLDGSILYSHNGEENFGSVGSVRLLIETEAVKDMPAGRYSTQLVLQVLSE